MAQIRNVNLNIIKLSTLSSVVSVSYELHFSPAELGAQFAVRVLLRGKDALFDDNLAPNLGPSGPITALALVMPITRSLIVSNDQLDEDRDVGIGSFIIRFEDEIYARIAMVRLFSSDPVIIQDSNVVRGHFGRGA